MFQEDKSSDLLSTISVEGNHVFQRSRKFDSDNPIFSSFSKNRAQYSLFGTLPIQYFSRSNEKHITKLLSNMQRITTKLKVFGFDHFLLCLDHCNFFPLSC